MYFMLLKTNDKIHFEMVENQEEMMIFIDTIDKKNGPIDYKKSIIVDGNGEDIYELMELVMESLSSHIVENMINATAYKSLVVLVDNAPMKTKITYGIEFEDGNNESEELVDIPMDESLGMEFTVDTVKEIINTTSYSFYVYYSKNEVVLSLEETEIAYDISKSFKQSFDNMDEVISLFEGFKNDFMEIASNVTETAITITDQVDKIHTYIISKITLMEWKDTQPIKFFNGRYSVSYLHSKHEIITDKFIDEEYMTAREVIQKLRISDQTLANWRKKNLITFRKISNRKFLYYTESVKNIFDNGIDTSGTGVISTNDEPIQSVQSQSINYEIEILKMLKPIAFKIPEYKFAKQNFFLNFGNLSITSSPQVMINNNYQLVDFIKKIVICETAKELYEYLIMILKEGKEPRVDTSKLIQPDFSFFYLNNLYDKNMVSKI